jgi:hypothetical protein
MTKEKSSGEAAKVTSEACRIAHRLCFAQLLLQAAAGVLSKQKLFVDRFAVTWGRAPPTTPMNAGGGPPGVSSPASEDPTTPTKGEPRRTIDLFVSQSSCCHAFAV